MTGLGACKPPNAIKQLLRKAITILGDFGRSHRVVQRLTHQRQYRGFESLPLRHSLDQGSKTTLDEALRISDTNTAMYSFGFSSARSAVSHEASKLESSEPGPEHGCFSRNRIDSEYEGHYNKQVLDCVSQLAPPLRLATVTFLAARDALRTKTAESIAQLTGGEFFHFHDAKDLKADLIAVSNDVSNYYVLSFRTTVAHARAARAVHGDQGSSAVGAKLPTRVLD